MLFRKLARREYFYHPLISNVVFQKIDASSAKYASSHNSNYGKEILVDPNTDIIPMNRTSRSAFFESRTVNA